MIKTAISRSLFAQYHLIITALMGLSLLSSLTTANQAIARSKSEARQEAFLLEKKGRERFAEERYMEAIELWRRAFDTYQDNKLLFFIASTYGRLQSQCEDESKAWSAYLSACKESLCPNQKRGEKGHAAFRARCYRQLTISANASSASAYFKGKSWGQIPLTKDLLAGRYDELKISAPGYLSQRLDIDLSDPSAQTKINVTLTPIPKETFFEKHQLKIAITSAITGVSILSVGLLQLSKASAISDDVSSRSYPMAFTSLEEQSEARSTYQADKSRYESAQLWGSALLTTGVLALGASAWILLYKGPNADIHERARQQGDLISSSDWSLQPLYTHNGGLDGAQAWWHLTF